MTDQTTPQPFPPTPEHERLVADCGTWNVRCSYFMAPGEPMVIEAVEKVEMHGRYFTVSLFEADMFGQPFQGRATIGYDPVREHYVSTWIDTMTPFLFMFTGRMDENGILRMAGDGPSPVDGEMVPYRTTIEHLDDGTRKFEMFVAMPGAPEMKMFSYLYSRAT